MSIIFRKEGRGLRKIRIEELDEIIKKNSAKANEIIINTSSNSRKKRSRRRSDDERKVLDQIAIKRWKDAVTKGKIKRIGDRKFYYDYRE